MNIEHKNRLDVSIEQIKEDEGLALHIEKPFDFFFLEEDGVNGVSEVAVDVTLTKSGHEIFAAGRAEGTVRFQCSRCLADFDLDLAPEIEAPFFPHSDEPVEDEPEDEGDINYYKGETMDLFPVIHDQLLLAMPVKPLCKEDCLGLCPKCGADLNTNPCNCPRKEPDARFAALKNLKEKL